MNQVEEALKALSLGKLIGLPTETVYGLAAPASSDEMVNKIFSLKERPFYDPLILHISDVEMAKRFVKTWPSEADLLAKAFWPGPLTLILEKEECVSDLITAGLSSVGVRCPDSPLALELINEIDDALAAPSANKFTKTSPSCAQHVSDTFDASDVFVIDGGACQVGIESTIVSLLKLKSENTIEVLRPGMITVENMKKVISSEIKIINGMNAFEENAARISPGLEKVHYSPSFSCGVIIESMRKQVSSNSRYLFVELNKNPLITAREVYSILRKNLPKEYEGQYFIVPATESLTQEEKQLWSSIMDRLIKASSLPCFI